MEKKTVAVVFRFDDYSSRSSTDLELRIIDAFRKRKASITLGVIPFIGIGDLKDPLPQDIDPLPPTKGSILKTGFEDGTLDIALHGYSHRTINTEQLTEFSGLACNSQVERLSKGKKFLEDMIGAPVTTFIPPWNTYDSNTLRALEQTGFSTLSAGKDGKATEDSHLVFMPASCPLSGLRDAVKIARTSSDTQPVIPVLFHEYDFKEMNEKRGRLTHQDFSDLLDWLMSQKDVRVLSIRQATAVIRDLSADRFLWNKRQRALSNLLPLSLRAEESMTLYPESHAMVGAAIGLKVAGFYLAIASLGAALSLAMALLVFPGYVLVMYASTLGSIALSAIVLIHALQNRQIHLKGLMVFAGAVGISIGSCLGVLYLRKQI